jgi:hypothetical protein
MCLNCPMKIKLAGIKPAMYALLRFMMVIQCVVTSKHTVSLLGI